MQLSSPQPAAIYPFPDSKIVPVASLFSEEERKTSRMYNEALVRRHGQKGLTMRLDGPGGSRIVWGIADPVDASGWSSSQIDLIGCVLPHLRQYVRVRTALVEAGALGTSATELLHSVRAGVVQLDRHGRIVEANDYARALLRRNDGLSDRGGELLAATPADNDRLQELLAQALPRFGERGASGSMMVRRTSLVARLALHVKPVTNREEDYRSREVAALVLIVDPLDRARIDPGLVEAVLGLTPAEAQIAVLLAEGRTARQIAAATGRGYNRPFVDLGGAYTRWQRVSGGAIEAGRELLGNERYEPHLDALGGRAKIEAGVARLEKGAVLDHLPPRIVSRWEKVDERVRETGRHRFFLPEHERVCELMSHAYSMDPGAQQLLYDEPAMRMEMNRQAEWLGTLESKLQECVRERELAQKQERPFVRQENYAFRRYWAETAVEGANTVLAEGSKYAPHFNENPALRETLKTLSEALDPSLRSESPEWERIQSERQRIEEERQQSQDRSQGRGISW